jgi:FKBP-type peptidyl-prolyl cis-trans isomerase
MASRGRAQRIFIWIIAVTMAVGSVGAYFLIILENENQQNEAAEIQQQYQDQLRRQSLPAQALEGHEATKFDANNVKELKTEDLKTGDGKEVKEDSAIVANYFGWLADGTIFDSTNRGGEVEPASFSLTGVIEGWTKGLAGAKEGTVRKIVIPYDMAYGEAGSNSIPPKAPLTFIVEIVKVES